MIIQIVQLSAVEKENTLKRMDQLLREAKTVRRDISTDGRIDIESVEAFRKTLIKMQMLMGSLEGNHLEKPLIQTEPIQITTKSANIDVP